MSSSDQLDDAIHRLEQVRDDLEGHHQDPTAAFVVSACLGALRALTDRVHRHEEGPDHPMPAEAG